MHLLLRHHCRFRALCLLSGEPEVAAGRAKLRRDWLAVALVALAFEEADFQQAVMARLDVDRDELISWREYLRTTVALDRVGSKLEFHLACHDTDHSDSMSRAKLCRMFTLSFGHARAPAPPAGRTPSLAAPPGAGRARPEHAELVERMVDELFFSAGKDASGEFRIDELRDLAERRLRQIERSASAPSAPERSATGARTGALDAASEVDVWRIFGETLVDATAAQHRRVEGIVQRAASRDESASQ